MTDLTPSGGISASPLIIPLEAGVLTGPVTPTGTSTDGYHGITGPAAFGSGGITYADSGSGDFAGVLFGPTLDVPAGYRSGLLSDTATYDNQTFASLGVTPGTYVWTWGSGVHADSFTLRVGAAAVPEPASLALFAMGLAGLGMVLRSRRA